jgi:hypothetical protein
LSDRQDKKRNENPDRNQKRRGSSSLWALVCNSRGVFPVRLFSRPWLLLAGTFHSVGAAAAAAVCVIIIIRPVPKEVVVCSSSKHKEQEQE